MTTPFTKTPLSPGYIDNTAEQPSMLSLMLDFLARVCTSVQKRRCADAFARYLDVSSSL